ncbi:MAG: type II toxin-antitoxin system death-on-curing family toxin [Bacillota bacterium]
MRYLTADEIIRIHDRIIARTGGLSGVLSRALVESAAGRPRASYGGCEAYPTVWLRAAALIESLAQDHAFVDGNKRTAWLVTVRFLARNGYTLRATPEDAVPFMLLVAQRQLPLEQIAPWLASRSGT